MDFQEIAKKRQKKWTEKGIYKVREDSNKKKFYVLDMFPYPSGAGLHVGHPKGFIATDVISRKKILEGYNVLHPMGFDTFGLGTENYAIEHKVKPQDAASKNIQTFKDQLEKFGFTYDWDREVNTADPKYFKRTQKIFLDLYNHYYDEKEQKAKPIEELEKKIRKQGFHYPPEKGGKGGLKNASKDPPQPHLSGGSQIQDYLNSQRLAYIDYKPINRCPSCSTGLANEDLEDGKCERCGSEIEQRSMRQWVLRITKYAERLLEGLEGLNRDESMKDMERNWIGKSTGTQFRMEISTPFNKGGKGVSKQDNLSFEVYTTRVDTIFGMSFVAIAPEHLLVDKITTDGYKDEINKYKDAANKKTQLERTELQKDKSGVFCGAYAINPFNDQKVPIFVADYVLANYGTGVVMAVPAHDERDYEFAKKYELPITQSIGPYIVENHNKIGYEINEIDSFTSIIKHSNEDKYLLIKFNNNKFGFVGGKVDGKEKKKDCLKREIVEETGYTNFKIKQIILEDAFGCGYKPHKDRIDKYHDKVFLVHILSEKNIGISEEEKAKHTTHRFTKDEIGKLNLIDHHRFYRETYLNGEGAYTQKGILVNSQQFSGLFSDIAIEKMNKRLEEKGIGLSKINYKLQDRVFSRQRYRGEPFPVVFCEKCDIVPLDEKDLPLELPDIENYEPTGTEEGPLANIHEWMNTTCPKCGGKARRESNTMPGRAGSSRYWMRYMDPQNNKELVSKQADKYRENVDVYVGGAEHVTRHMIYARFWQKFLYDIGIVSQDEPFKKYEKVGLIMGEDGRKMSKRRGNVVNPDDIIAEYGNDTLRVYEMFMGPFNQYIDRNTSGVKGVKKFLDKVIGLVEKVLPPGQGGLGGLKNTKTTPRSSSDPLIRGLESSLLHKTIKKVTEDIDNFDFNTAISQMMILVNELTKQESLNKGMLEKVIILLSPFAPHIAEELREKLGNEFSIFTKAQRPNYDEKLLIQDTVKIAVQFNGKVRGTIQINKDDTQDKVLEIIKADDKLSKYINGEPKKIIYISGRICNIVI